MDCVTQSVNQNDIRLKVHFVKQSNREKWFWVINRERFIISNPNRLINNSDLPNWWLETSNPTRIFGRIWVQNSVTQSNRVEFGLDPKPIRTNPWTTPGTRIAKKHEKWYNKKITLVKSRKQEKWCWSR